MSSALRGRILAIEDDAMLAAHIQAHLAAQGFGVDTVEDGTLGLEQARQGDYDLVLMDIMLPGLGGIDVLSRLRDTHAVPVLLMSALGAEQNRIEGFSVGADDFLPKPFSLRELEVRIEAILRRVRYERAPAKKAHGIPFVDQLRDVRCNGKCAQLTDSEYRLLQVLGASVDEPLSKAFLYQQVLNRPYTEHDRVLDMHISHVRRKLRAIDYTAGRIETVWGVGYVYRVND